MIITTANGNLPVCFGGYHHHHHTRSSSPAKADHIFFPPSSANGWMRLDPVWEELSFSSAAATTTTTTCWNLSHTCRAVWNAGPVGAALCGGRGLEETIEIRRWPARVPLNELVNVFFLVIWDKLLYSAARRRVNLQCVPHMFGSLGVHRDGYKCCARCPMLRSASSSSGLHAVLTLNCGSN